MLHREFLFRAAGVLCFIISLNQVAFADIADNQNHFNTGHDEARETSEYFAREFETFGATLKSANLDTLAELVNYLVCHRGEEGRVVERTGSWGAFDYNLDLSIRQAQIVRSYLRNGHGLSCDHIRAVVGLRQLSATITPIDAVRSGEWGVGSTARE